MYLVRPACNPLVNLRNEHTLPLLCRAAAALKVARWYDNWLRHVVAYLIQLLHPCARNSQNAFESSLPALKGRWRNTASIEHHLHNNPTHRCVAWMDQLRIRVVLCHPASH